MQTSVPVCKKHNKPRKSQFILLKSSRSKSYHSVAHKNRKIINFKDCMFTSKKQDSVKLTVTHCTVTANGIQQFIITLGFQSYIDLSLCCLHSVSVMYADCGILKQKVYPKRWHSQEQ